MTVFFVVMAYLAGGYSGIAMRRFRRRLPMVPPDDRRQYCVVALHSFDTNNLPEMEARAQQLARNNPKDTWGVGIVMRTWTVGDQPLVAKEYSLYV